ncbi:uncharacterized protein MELLADRAFT_96426 [Melampsora larici-populina 98AG31]|uniref:Uncharacterized protein n=1 Tax=Melampsora larici-populina (strain 98AG31 / pathotype 3-4-7) TaxID=747676 RepID=F4RES8_MELLP|nr:uncharacterized protein MELLADRAFT_96426 [Melampsora larici-populina 98AG31]EGG09152.1 hypothetical protein MELLADRAFT_96426 [Melampsora larici-populina 98AG31]
MSSTVSSNVIDSSSDVLAPTTRLHISTLAVSSAAAGSILEVVMSTRGSAEREPVSIPLTAHPGVKDGKDQCMKCGVFGHRTFQCAQFSYSAEPIPDWRRTTNGKIYSVKALLGMHPYCKWTVDMVLEESSSPSATPTPVPTSVASKPDNSPSATPTPVPASVASKPSNDDSTKLDIQSMFFQMGRSARSEYIGCPTPTPPATSSSPSSLHQAFNPFVTSWNDWFKLWNGNPNRITAAAAAISERLTGRIHMTVTVGRNPVLSRSD